MEDWLAGRLVSLSGKDREEVEGVVPYLLEMRDEKDRREFIEGFYIILCQFDFGK